MMLLEMAADMGIERFEATLVIAAVQHRAGGASFAHAAAASAFTPIARPRTIPLAAWAVLLATLQGAALAALWWVLST